MIPKYIHFIFGLEKGYGKKPFSFVHYLAIRSAIECNQKFKIYFHYVFEPTGVWWELIKGNLILVKTLEIDEIYGNRLYHFAHKADVLRLLILLKYGGIYLDMDTITAKSFDPLLNNSFVIGKQIGKNNNVEGLCNAVLLSIPNSEFLLLWLQQYKSFRSKGFDQFWSEHSVDIPLKLSELKPEWLKIEPVESFHYPSFSGQQLSLLFEECLEFPKAYCHHLWESLSHTKYLSLITPEYVKKVDTTYNIIARRFVSK